MKPLTLRPLVKTDLTRLHQWLNEPHLRPFYMKEPVSLNYVARKYTRRIEGRDPCHCMIAESDGIPFGYVQWVLNRDFPDYGMDAIGRPFGVSIDYFIGSTEYLGRRLGSEMLRTLVSNLTPLLNSQDRIFSIGHDDRNERAIRCTKRAGFISSGSMPRSKSA